jgi:hypothetical protein
MTAKKATCDIDQAAVRDLQKPEWISLNQALRVLAEGSAPMPESEFQTIESLQPPDHPAAKRILILALVRGQLRHKGELWRIQKMQSIGGDALFKPFGDGNESVYIPKAVKPWRSPTLLVKDYQVAPPHWAADRINFGSSELVLPIAPTELQHLPDHDHDPESDSYIVRRIVVSLPNLEKLSRPIEKTKSGGRPPKKEGLIKICAYTSAHIHHLGLPDKQAKLVDAVLGYAEKLPQHERLARTNVAEIVRAHYRAIEVFKIEK